MEERAQWLEKLAAAMKTRVPQIAEAIAHEVGTALGYATKVQAEFPIMMIGMNAKFIREATLEEELGNSLVDQGTDWRRRAASRRGTTRCIRSSARLRRRSPRAARSC